MAKKRVPFSKVAKAITGISTPIFGVSWNPPEAKRDVVRDLGTFLEDRRYIRSITASTAVRSLGRFVAVWFRCLITGRINTW